MQFSLFLILSMEEQMWIKNDWKISHPWGNNINQRDRMLFGAADHDAADLGSCMILSSLTYGVPHKDCKQ